MNDEYENATKDARINAYDGENISVRMLFINFLMFSLLVIGSYYLYLYYANSKNHHATIVKKVSHIGTSEANSKSHHATAVMGVSHTVASDDELMMKLDDIDVDEVTVEKENKNISDAMKNIIDSSAEEDSSEYVEKLANEIDNKPKEKNKKLAFEQRISYELKSIN